MNDNNVVCQEIISLQERHWWRPSIQNASRRDARALTDVSKLAEQNKHLSPFIILVRTAFSAAGYGRGYARWRTEMARCDVMVERSNLLLLQLAVELVSLRYARVVLG